ncbi:MAG: hypothetical protein ACRYE9_05795 [Janthinobacterium lividum]
MSIATLIIFIVASDKLFCSVKKQLKSELSQQINNLEKKVPVLGTKVPWHVHPNYLKDIELLDIIDPAILDRGSSRTSKHRIIICGITRENR